MDITDLFAFQKPGDPAKSILIFNVNPEAPSRAAAFDPLASYELKIDTNGDFEPDIAFHILYSSPDGGHQFATVYRAIGSAALATGPAGEVIIQTAPVSFESEVHITTAGQYRFFAGLRSDPFFADPIGFQNDMQWTGQDFFADKNVFGIVLELPNTALGSSPQISLWARSMIPVHGQLSPVNQVGRPGNNVFKGAATLNTTPLTQQRELFLPQYAAMFRSFGYSEGEAIGLAQQWLPDILPYNYTRPDGYPNGRRLMDDVVDDLVSLLTRGNPSTDLVEAHTDCLADFPYLGPPHPSKIPF
jgi:hypothetical protein